MLEYGLEWHTLDSYFQFKEQSSTPGTPEGGHLRVYAKDNGGTSALYYKNDAGTEVGPLGAGTVTGSGTANRLAYWSSSSVLAANAALTSTRIPFADANGLPTDSSNLRWNNTNGDLLLGGVASHPFAALDTRGPAVVRTSITSEYDAYSYGSSPAVNFRGIVSGGTPASPSQAAVNSVTGLILSGRDNNSAYVTGAAVQLVVDSAWTSTNRASRIVFSTVNTGETTLTERFRITAGGFVGVGHTNPPTKLTVADTSSNASRGVETEQFSADATAAQFALKKTRGASVGSFSASQSGDNLGALNIYGSHSTNFNDNSSVQIRGVASENQTNTATGGYLEITSTPNTTTGPVARFRVPEDGGIAIQDGITAPATLSGWAKIYVDSADGDLKVKFGNGFVAVIAADS